MKYGKVYHHLVFMKYEDKYTTEKEVSCIKRSLKHSFYESKHSLKETQYIINQNKIVNKKKITYFRENLKMIDYKTYITINPTIRFGKPCIKGTRISVYDVLSWFANGMSLEEIKIDFPELEDVQIRACLAYAADKEHKVKVA